MQDPSDTSNRSTRPDRPLYATLPPASLDPQNASPHSVLPPRPLVDVKASSSPTSTKYTTSLSVGSHDRSGSSTMSQSPFSTSVSSPYMFSSSVKLPPASSALAGSQGHPQGLSRPLTVFEQENLTYLDRLKAFLATATSHPTLFAVGANTHPSATVSGPPTVSSSTSSSTVLGRSEGVGSDPSSDVHTPNLLLNRFMLPSQEYVSCVLWDGKFYITGTDIIRALVFRFEALGRPVQNMKKFEEGVFVDLRRLKPGMDARLEKAKSAFLDQLFRNQCIRTQKKQKVFRWFSVDHERLFFDALERELGGVEPTTQVVGEPAMSSIYNPGQRLYQQSVEIQDVGDSGTGLGNVVQRVEQNTELLKGPTRPDFEDDDQMRKSIALARKERYKKSVDRMLGLLHMPPTYKQQGKKPITTDSVQSRDDGNSVSFLEGKEDEEGAGPDRHVGAYVDKLMEGPRFKFPSPIRLPPLLPPLTTDDPRQGSMNWEKQPEPNTAKLLRAQQSKELMPAGDVVRKSIVPHVAPDVGLTFSEGFIPSEAPQQQPRLETSYTLATSSNPRGIPAPDGKIRAFMCAIESCGLLFQTAEGLERHSRTHTTFSCSICHSQFSSSEQLDSHLLAHEWTNYHFGSAAGSAGDAVSASAADPEEEIDTASDASTGTWRSVGEENEFSRTEDEINKRLLASLDRESPVDSIMEIGSKTADYSTSGWVSAGTGDVWGAPDGEDGLLLRAGQMPQFEFPISPTLGVLGRAMVPDAIVDSCTRYAPRCHPGTRTTLIDRIQNWVLDDRRAWDVLWLHGPAGVGKSTVAQTTAEIALEKGCLGAVFFFSRPNGCHNAQSVFITLAYQLAVHFPGYLPLVAQQLAEDLDLLTKSPGVQFRRLVIEPLRSLTHQLKHLIILDGLDECIGEQAQSDIIELINDSTRLPTSLPVIWMICSRAVPHLVDIFSRTDFAIQCWREELAIDTPESREDTERFIRERFKEIHERYGDIVDDEDVAGSWPSEDDVSRIIDAVSGLFVFANTILKYIEDPEFGQPNAHLANVLMVIQQSRAIGRSSPMEALDQLYTRILSEIPEDMWSVTRRLLRITTDQVSPVGRDTPQLLYNFMGISGGQFCAALEDLHSVLDVPLPEDAEARPLRFLHSSFFDYLVDPDRSGLFCIASSLGSEPNDEMQRCSLHFMSTVACYLAAGFHPSAALLQRFIIEVFKTRGNQMLSDCFPWPSPDPAMNWEFARVLFHVARSNIFSSYSKFRTHDDHQELIDELRNFDFNTLAFTLYDCDSAYRELPHFVCWTKKTPLHGLVRTNSTGEMDNKLLLRSAGTQPLDFDVLAAHRSFDGLQQPAYFLMGYGTNSVLVLVGAGQRPLIQYDHVKSELHIWPALQPGLGASQMTLVKQVDTYHHSHAAQHSYASSSVSSDARGSGELAKSTVASQKTKVASGEHRTEFLYECSVPGCGSILTSSHQFRSHMNTHLEAKRYRCRQCEKSFGSSAVRRRHEAKYCRNRVVIPM